jgi:OCT family organic cation transporter-like MFS transporter 4/5
MAPFIFIFFSWKILPESPRWLITQGRTKEASKILRKVAETNNVTPPANLEDRIARASTAMNQKSMGYLSLFANATLGVRTVLITIGFTASAFVYYQMVVNVSNMYGNTFMNMFLLGLVEGPGNVLGVVMANKLGRRWTHFSLLFLNALLFLSIVPLVKLPQVDEQMTPINTFVSPLTSFFCMWIKLNISATFIVAYIQAMEIFPTCVRQSGIGTASVIAQIISIGGPHVIALGATDLMIPYIVMFLVCLAGASAVIFLPETNGLPLPETLEDAQRFGKGDPFCSWKPPQRQYVPPLDQKNIYKLDS